MVTIQQIKRLSIRTYLSDCGILPHKENSRYGFYFSPLREERTPSFKVDYLQNLWYDFGLGEGGSIIDLVMRLERCDFTQAIRLLGGNKGVPIAASVPPSVSPNVPTLRILFDMPLRHPALVGYLSSRGIDPAIAAVYCREVHYAINGREYFAVGFRNDAGGWELRSECFKGSASPKHITTIDHGSDTVVAFEGFMDFMSYLKLKNSERLLIDAVVLNSIVNTPKAFPFLERHSSIRLYFDNDDAGRKATAEIVARFRHIEVVDRCELYRGFKDINEYLSSCRHSPIMAPDTDDLNKQVCVSVGRKQ